MSESSDSVKISINTRIQHPTGYKENKKERHERNMSWTRNKIRETISEIAENGLEERGKRKEEEGE